MLCLANSVLHREALVLSQVQSMQLLCFLDICRTLMYVTRVIYQPLLRNYCTHYMNEIIEGSYEYGSYTWPAQDDPWSVVLCMYSYAGKNTTNFYYMYAVSHYAISVILRYNIQAECIILYTCKVHS